MKKLLTFLMSIILVIEAAGVVAADDAQVKEFSAADFYDSHLSSFYLWNDTPAFQYFLTHARPFKPELIIGDVNFDGKINATDALFAIRYTDPRQNIFAASETWEKLFPHGIQDNAHGSELDFSLELSYRQHEQAAQTESYTRAQFDYFWCNSVLLSDVTGNTVIEADDVLMILQYAVGTRTAFPRTDTSVSPQPGSVSKWYPNGIYPIFYVEWPDDIQKEHYTKIGFLKENELNFWPNDYYEYLDAATYFEKRTTEYRPRNLTVGDVNMDGIIDVQDIAFTICYVYPWQMQYNYFKANRMFSQWEGTVTRAYREYKNNTADLSRGYAEAHYWYYRLTSVLLADVDGSGNVDAFDVYMLTQYVAGNRKDFPRKDLEVIQSNASIQQLVWPDDWKPGMSVVVGE